MQGLFGSAVPVLDVHLVIFAPMVFNYRALWQRFKPFQVQQTVRRAQLIVGIIFLPKNLCPYVLVNLVSI